MCIRVGVELEVDVRSTHQEYERAFEASSVLVGNGQAG